MAKLQTLNPQIKRMPVLKKWHLIVALIFLLIITRGFGQLTKTNALFVELIQEQQSEILHDTQDSRVDCLSVDKHRQQGLCYAMQNDLANLEEVTLTILDDEPGQQMMVIHLGSIYRDANLENETLTIWEQFDAWTHLASLAIETFESGEKEKGADIIEMALDNISAQNAYSNPQKRLLKIALDNLAEVRIDQEDYTAAIEAYKIRLLFSPTSPYIHRQIGDTYHHLGNYAEAKAWLKEAEKLDPDDINVTKELGRVAASEGRWWLATAYFEQVISVKSNAYSQYELGIAYENIEQYSSAQQAFENALILAEDNKIKYRLALARVCEQNDCHDISFTQYCLILEEEPEHEIAREKLFSLWDKFTNQIPAPQTYNDLTTIASDIGHCT